MFTGNSVTGVSFKGFQQHFMAKEVKTVEQFAHFLMENKGFIKENAQSLILYIGANGPMEMGSMIIPSPDPSIQIGVFTKSANDTCGMDVNSQSITVRGPVSHAEIPTDLLTKEHIKKACELADWPRV